MMITATVYGMQRRRWRRAEVRRWKEDQSRGFWRRSLSLLFKFCLLAAFLAETGWFAASFITVERVEETQGIYKTDPGPERTGRGIRLRLDDGAVSLFEVEERAVFESD